MEKEGLTEIVVTDPQHPLWGRRFSIVPIDSHTRIGSKCVYISYQDMVLRLPIAATNLVPARPTLSSKLTLEAIEDLISLAEQWEVPCPSNPTPSGDSYPQVDKSKLPLKSR
jgi:hypothetical protein